VIGLIEWTRNGRGNTGFLLSEIKKRDAVNNIIQLMRIYISAVLTVEN